MREETGRVSRSIRSSVNGIAEFWGFDCGLVYTTSGLLVIDGIHLSQRGKRIFTQELTGLIKRALNYLSKEGVT